MLYYYSTERGTMLTKDKGSSIVVLSLVVLIVVLTVNIISKFTILDFAYLMFIIGCLFKFIYIKFH